MLEHVGFGVVALCMLISAVAVVRARNLVRCVLWLGVTLLGTSVLYVMLESPFLAGIQVLLYTGGVITLMLFGVMMTRKVEGVAVENEHSPKRRGPAALLSFVIFGVLTTSILEAGPLMPEMGGMPVPTKAIGRAFLTQHLLAFEVLSLLLLAAMIGAIVISRRHDHGAASSAVPLRGRAAKKAASSRPEPATPTDGDGQEAA